jgi:nicotinate (nicotinamide) nucleotide adenylyltransferase
MKRIAVFGGSFNPPGIHHRLIAEVLAERFDEVVVVPCGPRPDKDTTNDTDPLHRAAMTDIAFRDIPNVRVDLFDLEQQTFTRTHQLDEIYRAEGEVWHVVGTDLVLGGGSGKSRIHEAWDDADRLWQELQFAVVTRADFPIVDEDLPPHHEIFEIKVEGASSTVRERLFKRQSYKHLVQPAVARYISRYGLYRGRLPNRATLDSLDEPRLWIVRDEWSEAAEQVSETYSKWEVEEDPNAILVVGGDGTMLRAIRQHWRLRLPFIGVNAGHLGFLLNDRATMNEFPPAEVIRRQCRLLYVEFELEDGTVTNSLAFNDAWVERATSQTAWLEVTVDGKVRMERMVGDGILACTAQGSTAYARAMGAAPLLADTEAWMIVGSNVLYPEGWKSGLLSQGTTVSLRCLDCGKRPINGFVDGVSFGRVRALHARISRIAAAELTFLPEHDMAEKIAQIQFPPSDSFP